MAERYGIRRLVEPTQLSVRIFAIFLFSLDFLINFEASPKKN